MIEELRGVLERSYPPEMSLGHSAAYHRGERRATDRMMGVLDAYAAAHPFFAKGLCHGKAEQAEVAS